MDVVVWLRSLGLGKYEAAFRENEVDLTFSLSLRRITFASLLSHYPTWRSAQAPQGHCGARAAKKQNGPVADTAHPIAQAETAERRQVTVMFCDLVGSMASSSSPRFPFSSINAGSTLVRASANTA